MPLEIYNETKEIEELIAAFDACTLPRPSWTHRAHLTIAVWYLRAHPVAAAGPLIKQGILKLNSSLGIVSDLDSGYHETITQFFTGLVRHHLDGIEDTMPLLELTNSLLCKHGDKNLPLQYWSKERLMSRA